MRMTPEQVNAHQAKVAAMKTAKQHNREAWLDAGRLTKNKLPTNPTPEDLVSIYPPNELAEIGLTRIIIVIRGEIRGGKNSVQTTRTGHRYPNPKWAKWRDQKVSEVKAQLPKNWKPISEPKLLRLEYVAGDKRRRDMPAIIDSVFHILEKSGFVTDDTLLWFTQSSRAYDKTNPRAVITIL